MGITMALEQNNYDNILKQSLFAQGDAFKQADLNSLYNQQQLEQAKNQTLEGQFKNQQSQVMNPLLVDQQRQQNANLGYVGQGQQNANVISGNNAELSTANQGNALSKQAREAAISASDDEMKQLGQHITKMYMDPATRADAVALEQLMPEMRKARATHADAMEKAQEETYRHLEGIKAQTGAQERMQRESINAGRWKPKGGSASLSIQERVAQGKMSAQQAAVAFHAAAQFSEDPDLAQKYETMAQQYEQQDINRPSAGKVGGIDLPAVANLPAVAAKPTAYGPTSPVTKPQHSLSTVQQQYPGVPAEKLKELYKKKFGVDLQ